VKRQDAATVSRQASHRTWLFDLDNTLHNANLHIFPRISRSMTAYMCEHLKVDEAEATRLRKSYWQRYGATLLGLMRHHDIDPNHFLNHTHQFPDLPKIVVAERGLRAMLRRLPGRKIIFSNAPKRYTEAVLTVTGVIHSFDAVYSIERLRFEPKPATAGFLRLLHDEKLDPNTCIMVEDTLANLKTAKRLGMKTVWVSANTRRPPCVDVRLSSILDLPRRLGQI
jgi:putative hydrolase of the HAD superfamily